MQTSFALILAAIVLLYRALPSRGLAAVAAVVVFGGLSLGVAYLVIDRLTGAGIDHALLFHLWVGLKGAAVSDFAGLAATGFLLFALACLIGYGVYRIAQGAARTLLARLRVAAAAVALGASFFFNPAVGDILALVRPMQGAPAQASARVPDDFALVERIRFAGRRKNLVILYLESLERTYLDETLFPGLAPNLRALESRALSFTDISQEDGTNWTIAGMVASQCGLPLIGVGANNAMSGLDRFLPGATCLGDLMARQGYELSYMGGADLDFAGKGNFYHAHGFASVEGLDELRGALAQPDYLSNWGLYDDSLYGLATARFDRLAAGDVPFGLVMLTLDTHHPNGYMSRACGDEVYRDGANPILNSVHCADRMAGAFITHVLNSPAAADTVLVVMSDHLAMPNTARRRLESAARRDLVLVFDPDTAPATSDKPGTTLDLGPTILGLIGAQTPALGFGRDLRGPEATLRTRLAPLDAALNEDWRYLSSLWSFAQLRDGIRADLSAGRLGLGDRYVKLPVLFLLEPDLNVREIHFEFYDNTRLSTRVAGLAYDQRFVWVDRCDTTAMWSAGHVQGQGDICMLAGTLGADALQNIALRDATELSAERIAGLVNASVPDADNYGARLADMQRIRDFGTTDVVEYTGSPPLAGDFAIRSAGFTAGASQVTNLALGAPVRLRRGLTVLGLQADHAPVKIGYIDSCAYGGAEQDVVAMQGDFATLINHNAESYGAFAIVGHDSVLCYQVEAHLETLFRGSGLTRWRELDFEQPYIALITGDGAHVEYVGAPRTALAVHAQSFIDPGARAVVHEVIEQRLLDRLPRVAHAGGGYQGGALTDSLSALDHNAGAFDLFEMDLSWTSDGALVCLHDWEDSFRQTFGVAQPGPVSLAAFEALVQAHAPYENCTLATLADWMWQHPDKRIVLDIKERVLYALQKIARTYPGLRDRFIVQIYQPRQYAPARSFGFRDIIWTLYKYDGDDAAVLKNLDAMNLLGLCMPIERAERGLAARAQDRTGVLSWVHTVNTQAEYDRLRGLGVSEVYTDFLRPP